MKQITTIKHDTPENWSKAVNFTPKDNELIIYDFYLQDNELTYKLKLGDGLTKVNDLPFINLQQTTKTVCENGVLIL